MKHLFLVRNANELAAYQGFAEKHRQRFADYLQFLREDYETYDLPRCVVWTSAEAATGLIGEIPAAAAGWRRAWWNTSAVAIS